MTAEELTIAIKAEISHALRQKIDQERWRRQYRVTTEQLIREAVTFYFMEHMPAMIDRAANPAAN